MKQLMFSLLFIAFVSAAFSQKTAASKVPQAVINAFTAAHPGIVATWEKENGSYEANFTESGKEMSCVLNANGHILETETAISIAGLPSAARAYVKRTYKGSVIKEAAKIVTASGEITFEAQVGKKDLMFDEKGNFLKAVAL